MEKHDESIFSLWITKDHKAGGERIFDHLLFEPSCLSDQCLKKCKATSSLGVVWHELLANLSAKILMLCYAIFALWNFDLLLKFNFKYF